MALPHGSFEIIYADPPWSYYGDPNKDQAAGKHYSLMSTADISELPVRSIAANRSALFLWATGPRLPEAIEVMRTWGFHYRGVAYVWVKTAIDGHIIAGQGVRPTFVKPTTELVLVGSTNARGRAFPLLSERQGQVILAPRGAHSEKPDCIRDAIVALLGDRPRVELFATARFDGWEAWGDGL